MHHLRDQIEAAIQLLGDDYRAAPGSVLTEDDLQCLLVNRLLQIPELSRQGPTADGLLGSMIHTEVSWFDGDGKLRIKPDITILDPGTLSLFQSMRKGYPLPNKGFSFAGKSIIFELTFIRNRQGVTAASLRAIRRDLDKVIGLFRRLDAKDAGGELFCYFVVFGKVTRQVPEFVGMLGGGPPHPMCKLVFATAGVAWPRKSGG